ncbi:MAG: UvrD-helicase domain-containing protein [Bdellovibrionota bacterium]
MSLVENLTRNLNPTQKKAVETLDGALLILAGAGSGKTRVLTHRMANLIGQGICMPEEILCVTFTNKAAQEMEHRIYNLLVEIGVPVTRDLWISTFHSFCVRILRRHIELLDYKKPFTIYDSSDQLAQIKKVMQALNINDKMFPPKSFQSRISNSKMLGLAPENLRNGSKNVIDQKTLEVYTRYEEEMKRANALDFDDLLLKTYDLFRMYPDLLAEYQNQFRYIMVDEYQDTNRIQYLLVQQLASAHKNLCVVGDEDQSIYSWRGADISNILDFEKDFPNATIVKLEENYRSSANIVTAATKVIANNTERKDKTLFTNNEPGELIQVREERNEYDEARYVAKSIEELMNTGESLNNFAIFYRTNAQSRVLEEQLRTLLIPYRLIGGMRFYERAEVKDAIAYLRMAMNSKDDIAVKRIINVPARGIGKTTVEKIDEIAANHKISFFEAIQKAIDNREFPAGTVGKLRRFYELAEGLISQRESFKLSEFYSIVLERTEYTALLKKEDTAEADARINNLQELENAMVQFEKERGDEATLSNYLEEMTLASDQDQVDQNFNAVTMMTLHISKGLEYPYVFIVGCEESLFPSIRGGADEIENHDLEEERRLAYVGMTRARKKLWLTHAKVRRVWGQEQMNAVSRFINEIPKELIKKTSAVTAFGVSSFASKYGSRNDDAGYGSFGQTNSYGKNKTGSFDDSQSFPDYDEYSQAASAARNGGYAKGMKVRHPTFGPGSIFDTEGSGENLKISVLFQDNTIKKFVAKYARLERL